MIILHITYIIIITIFERTVIFRNILGKTTLGFGHPIPSVHFASFLAIFMLIILDHTILISANLQLNSFLVLCLDC